MNYYEIGQRIRKFRKMNGYSQEELAEKVDISTTHMSHIETGNTKLSLSVLVTLADILNVQTDELLFARPRVDKCQKIDGITSLLENCSSQQLSIIHDIVKATIISLNKNASPMI